MVIHHKIVPRRTAGRPDHAGGPCFFSSAIYWQHDYGLASFSLVRDILYLARMFGPGDGTDAFFHTRLKFPNFLQCDYLHERGFQQAFVPVLSEITAVRKASRASQNARR